MLRLIKNILIFSSLFSFILAEDLALGSSIPLPDVKMVDISGKKVSLNDVKMKNCLLYTSPSPRDATLSRMPSSA